METLDLLQGSEQWKAIRGKYLVASEAPVIMGVSPHTKRDELLFLKKAGEEKFIHEWVERFIFKKGHENEEKARPIAEARLGEDLYPVTGLNNVDGLPLLASFDGITMLEDNHWEHKQFNKELFALVSNGEDLKPEHYWQLEHQMLVAGTACCIFAVSDGTENNYVERVYWSDTTRREKLIHGWKLFLSDLESYEPKVYQAELVGKSPMDLPALRIEIEGGVRASNLDTYRQVAMDVFAAINTDLQNDEDFANAEKTVKWCQSVEDKLEAAKQHALSQTADIDELFRMIDDLREESRKVRLNLDNRVKNRKKERKLEIAKAAKEQFEQHIETLNKALGGDYMPRIETDFNGAMKSKRTIATLENAANDEFTRVRIEANRIATKIEENLELFAKLVGEHEFLFADKRDLVIKTEKVALEAVIKQRIADHNEAEEKRKQVDQNAECLASAQAEMAESSKSSETRWIPETTVATTVTPAAQTSCGINNNQITTAKPEKPSDHEIISVLKHHFNVDEQTVISWLMEINLRDASTPAGQPFETDPNNFQDEAYG